MRDQCGEEVARVDLYNEFAMPVLVLHGNLGQGAVPASFNQRLLQFTGITQEALSFRDGGDIYDFIHPDDREKIDAATRESLCVNKTIDCTVRIRTGNGIYAWVNVCGNCKKMHDGFQLFLTFRDATQAEYDAMTGLLNGRSFCNEVRKILNAASNRKYRIIRIGMGGFSPFGGEPEDNGDKRLLRQFGADLLNIVSNSDRETLVSHFDRDHFLAFCPVDGVSPESLYDALTKLLSSYFKVEELTLSMGVYDIEDPSVDVVQMCDDALLALHSAKAGFSDHVCYYAPEMKKPEKVQTNNTVNTNNTADTGNAANTEIFRSLFSDATDMILVADRKSGELLYANRAAELFYHKSFNTGFPVKWNDFSNLSGECKEFPFHFLFEEDIEIEKSVNGHSLRVRYVCMDWEGHSALLIRQKDITGSKREQETLKALFRSIPGAAIIFCEGKDGEPRCIYLSDLAQKLVSGNGQTVMVHSLADCFGYVHPNDRERIKAQTMRCIQTKTQFHEKFRFLCEDENVKWVDFIINPIVDSTGDCLYYGIYHDISAEKQIAADLEEKQKRTIEIYQQMVSDESNEETEKLLMSVHMDLTDHTILKGWCDEKECSLQEITDQDGRDIMQKLFDTVIGEEEGIKVRELFDRDTMIRIIREQGYGRRSAEYMRENKSGRICLVRTEAKMFINPQNGHDICFVMTYDIGSVKAPNMMLEKIVSHDLDNVGLYNIKTGISQVWEMGDAKGYNGRLISDYEVSCNEYALMVVEQERERFLEAIRMQSILKYLSEHTGAYRFSFWTEENGRKSHKTWEYYYLNAEKTVLVMARYDTTDSFLNHKEAEERLSIALDTAEKLRYDSMTGLLTRGIAVNEIEACIASGESLTNVFIMIDIDELKRLNDTYGHPEGDKALSLISKLLKESFRDCDIIGRVGGDEFMVFMKNVSDDEFIRKRLKSLLAKANAIKINENEVLHCSIGYVVGTSKEHNFGWMYRRADRALYEAKRMGKNCFCKYHHTHVSRS